MIRINHWRSRFYKVILERGQNYYRYGMVHDMEVDENNTITARVGNEYFYDVCIHINDDGTIRSMKCSCPFAEEGRNCKHEAAVLYSYEKNYADHRSSLLKKKPQNEVIAPFKDDFEKETYFFDLHKLTKDYRIRKKMYEEAERMVEDKKIVLERVMLSYDAYEGQQILQASAVYDGNYSQERVQIRINSNRILSLNCENYSCKGYNSFGYYYRENGSLCVHKIAMLLLLKDYILKKNPGDLTDGNGFLFLNEFMEKETSASDEEAKEIIQLEPKLEYDGNGTLKLGFKIGIEKTYVLKDIAELIEKEEEKGVYPLGTRNYLNFARETFNQRSMEYFSYLKGIFKEEDVRKRVNASIGRYRNEEGDLLHGGFLTLFGRNLDSFYDLSEDRKIEISDRSGSKNQKYLLELKEGNPDLNLEIAEIKKNGQFTGFRISGEIPDLLHGNRYGYYIHRQVLYRMAPSFSDLIQSLEKGSEGHRIDLIIGEKHLPQFYHHVLPLIRDKINIKEETDNLLARYESPRPEYDFYFDISNGIISCRSEIRYENEVYPLFGETIKQKNRDYTDEERIKQLLLPYFDGIDENDDLYVEGEDHQILQLLEELIPQLQKTGNVHSTDAFDRLKIKRRPKINVGVSVSGNLLELSIGSEDLSLEELSAIISSYRQKKKFHKLKNGELIRSDDESIEELDAMLNVLNIPLKQFVQGKINIPSYRALYLDKLLEKNEMMYDNRDVYFDRLIQDFKTIKEAEYNIPASLTDIMRPYQKEGYRWLKALSHFGFGGILADEMGLGKTLQMISVLLDQKKEENVSLIVCPASLVYNWKAEFDRFAPEMKVQTITGSQSERKEMIRKWKDYDVLITSYDLLKRDVDLYDDVQFCYEILDEAQYIKTHTTANAKACKVINARKHFALTGTPIENNLSELWSIFDFLMPGFLYSYETFKNQFEIPIAKNQDEKISMKLKQMVSPFILRRKKMDVLSDLPEKLEETIKVRFEQQQQKLYDSQVLKMSKQLSETSDESFGRNKIQILAELMRIRQICCEPGLLFENYNGESAKRQACLEMIRNAIEEGHKILLFSQFTSMLEILEKELHKEEISCYKITGQTKKEDRLKLVEQFNANDIPVFLISLKAGGTGLNLTGADIVIHYDPWWNLAAQNQATDRAHRIGQDKIVSVYKIIAEGTIEEKIVELQDKKSELAETILSGETVNLSSMSKQELLELLK